MLNKKTNKIASLKSQCADLEARLAELEVNSNFLKVVKEMFSPKQIQLLKAENGESFVHWSDEDIAKAISLDSVSTKAYEYLRTVLKYPIPSRTTVQRWLSQIHVTPGILEPVIKLLTACMQNASEMDRIGALAFDEMAIDEKLCYSVKEDKVYGGSDQMLGNILQNYFITQRSKLLNSYPKIF